MTDTYLILRSFFSKEKFRKFKTIVMLKKIALTIAAPFLEVRNIC
jgi:hypothetical protein